jgi:hypothetical protein
MGSDRSTPPPFYCPACGKKHRADLSALLGQPGAVAKVTCARCGAVMALRIGEDGLPRCEIPQPAADAAAPAARPVGRKTPSGGPMPKSALLVPVLAAAVAAAVVSFVVAKAAGGKPPPAKAGDEVAALHKTVDDLRGEVASLREALATATAASKHDHSDLQAQLQVATERVGKLEGAAGKSAELAKAVAAAQEATKDFNGRIEANYTTLHALSKRVEKLEGK